MKKKEIHDILKQIYHHVQHEYDSHPVNLKVIEESLAELRKFKLTEPTSKQGKELYALVKKSLEEYIALPKNGELASIEQGLLLLQLLREFQAQDQLLAKEEHQKKENELHTEIQEATHRKFQQIAAEVAQMIQQRIKLEIEYQQFLERQRKETEEDERKKLLAIALAAFRELFEELENSTVVSKIVLDGREVDVGHKAIFMLDDYKNLHEKYFTNEISEDDFMAERLRIVLQSLRQHHSPEATRDHAVAVDRNMMAEMKQIKSYLKAKEARQKLEGVKTEKVATQTQKLETEKEKLETETEKFDTRVVREEKDEKAENVSGEKVKENETEENVDVEDYSLVENSEAVRTDKVDKLNDILDEFDEERVEVTSTPPAEAPRVVDKMIETVKAAVAVEKEAKQENKKENKKENKQKPGEENNETSPSPRPHR